MTTIALKLTEPIREQAEDILTLERRRSLRRPTFGQVTALRDMPGHETAVIRKICSLKLSDISDTGVGVICDEAIEPDTTITILFPPHGPDGGFNATGQVVRCMPRPDGQAHRIGIRFNERSAA